MNEQRTHEITRLLRRWKHDRAGVIERILPLVYAELESLASSKLRMERRGHTLQTSDLVHEAYFRLVDQNRVDWQDRSHFFAIAAQAMRRVLVDHARKYATQKRINPRLLVPLDSAPEPGEEPNVDVIALDEALESLAKLDQRQARVVELCAFVGLTQEEAAEVLGISAVTVYREWRTAKLWLRKHMQQKGDSPASETQPPPGADNGP